MHTSRTLILEEEEEREVASVPDLLMIQGRGVLATPDGPTRSICPVPVRNHFHAMRPLLAPRRKIEFRFTLSPHAAGVSARGERSAGLPSRSLTCVVDYLYIPMSLLHRHAAQLLPTPSRHQMPGSCCGRRSLLEGARKPPRLRAAGMLVDDPPSSSDSDPLASPYARNGPAVFTIQRWSAHKK